ncbi:carboxypeptidase-like regulatory domain-containing protein [Pontibacter qinzhouensis]|uniref:Carboxypeptidase-like regulatory domain-containing protein n=1 Tax=Pontibacter qinzhouensis TaxID=2603253 RepID=A0A5C8JAY0_9BACT|nr:DUF5686 and carboxypeptidase regulatory-like domain-containing protein [Pontibacter qinzhouensis]TXK33874.1 carboxypeptidase-like regulatory domain-containing protein [Pontibacter qinzhouensis]
MRTLCLVIFVLWFPFISMAAIVHGRVTDESGQGLPYASIYIRETASGTGTNENGDFQLQLSPGTYTIEFKYVGYKASRQTVTLTEEKQLLNVQLEPEVLSLNEVVVRAADEDPAYPIMRNAIRLRKYHLNETNAWSARVYMKTMGRMEKVPTKILGVKLVDIDTGIVYLSESVSELHFKKPNKINERMISSRVSGQKKGFSFNQASEMNISFYENLLKVEGLNERGFVSPLANNALFYYQYEYLGAFEENGLTINKIKVTPRRKNDPAFAGSIYIVDGTWRIHSTDLRLSKSSGIEFIDYLRVRQVYAPVQEHVWMPVSQRFTFEASGLGFKGSGYATGVYSNYKVQPAYSKPPVLAEVPPEPEAAPLADAPPARRQQKPKVVLVEPQVATPQEQQPIHEEGLFSKEVLFVEPDANKRDAEYWATVRPVPLTQEEQQDYQVKDSLQVIKESKPYQDSLDRVRNEFSFAKLFLRGYTYSNTYRRISYNFDPLVAVTGGPSILQFNTVEGLVADVRMAYTRTMEDRRRYEIEPAVRYGFSNEKLNAKLRMSYRFDPVRYSNISLEGGRYVQDINNVNAISPFVNTLYTLLAQRNYMKLYQRDFAALSYGSELLNGLRLNMTLDYAHRMPLQNTTDFSFRKSTNEDGSSRFTSNVPINAERADAAFTPHQALTAAFNVSYKPGMRYISRPNQKINLGSKWPRLSFGYRTGLKALGGDVQYQTAAFRVSDYVSLGLFGSSNYSFTAGTFWGKENMQLMDFKHFNGNRTIFAGVYTGFQLLDYYRYSTANKYLEGHFEHHFDGFLFNKIPLFRKLKWQEVVSLNYLNTVASGNYVEIGLGIEHIFKVVRVDFVTSFQEGSKARTGLMIGLGF